MLRLILSARTIHRRLEHRHINTFRGELIGLFILFLLWIIGASIATVSTLIEDGNVASSLICPVFQHTGNLPDPETHWGDLSSCWMFSSCRVLTALVAFTWASWVLVLILFITSFLFAIANKAFREPMHGRWDRRATYYGDTAMRNLPWNQARFQWLGHLCPVPTLWGGGGTDVEEGSNSMYICPRCGLQHTLDSNHKLDLWPYCTWVNTRLCRIRVWWGSIWVLSESDGSIWASIIRYMHILVLQEWRQLWQDSDAAHWQSYICMLAKLILLKVRVLMISLCWIWLISGSTLHYICQNW